MCAAEKGTENLANKVMKSKKYRHDMTWHGGFSKRQSFPATIPNQGIE